MLVLVLVVLVLVVLMLVVLVLVTIAGVMWGQIFPPVGGEPTSQLGA